MFNMFDTNGDVSFLLFGLQFAMAFIGALCLAVVAVQAAARRIAGASRAARDARSIRGKLSALTAGGHDPDEPAFRPLDAFDALDRHRLAPARVRVNGVTVRTPRMRSTDRDRAPRLHS